MIFLSIQTKYRYQICLSIIRRKKSRPKQVFKALWLTGALGVFVIVDCSVQHTRIASRLHKRYSPCLSYFIAK